MENLNINYDKTVSNATVSMISAGAILVISVLIVLLVLVIKRWKGRFIPLALGVLSYVVFGFMFSQLLMSVLSLNLMLISHLRIIQMHMWLYIIFCLQQGLVLQDGLRQR